MDRTYVCLRFKCLVKNIQTHRFYWCPFIFIVRIKYAVKSSFWEKGLAYVQSITERRSSTSEQNHPDMLIYLNVQSPESHTIWDLRRFRRGSPVGRSVSLEAGFGVLKTYTRLNVSLSRSPYRLGCNSQLLLQCWPACHHLLASVVMDQTSETASEPPVKHFLL